MAPTSRFRVFHILSVLTLLAVNVSNSLDLNFSAYNNSTTVDSQTSLIELVYRELDRVLTQYNAWQKYEVNLDLSHNDLDNHALDILFNETWRFLTSLDVSHNKLTVLKASWFSSLNNLQELDVSDNLITDLPAGSLPPRLTKFLASGNKLTEIEEFVFHGLNQLVRLDVSHNHISHVHLNAFEDSNSLTDADFSFNKLTTFEPWPYLLQHALVNLSHNVISSFANPGGYTVNREMSRMIDLQYNNLTRLREEDISMYLKGQKPAVIEAAMRFRLNIRYNPFICDCQIYWIVRLVKNGLLCSSQDAHNYITCASPPSLQGRNLGYLLSHGEQLVCGVEEGCPEGCSCQDTPHYGVLIVTCHPDIRRYRTLPASVPGAGPVALNLSGHAVQQLDVDRPYLDRLQLLDVRANKLQHIPPSFVEAAHSLTQLDARDNELTALPSTLQRLTVDKLGVSGNPLRCSCDLLWFGNWVKAVAANVTSDSDRPSTSPPHTADGDFGSLAGLGSWSRVSNQQTQSSVCGTTAALNATQSIADALRLRCVLTDRDGTAEVKDTGSWGVDCGSRVVVHVLVSVGVVLAVLLVAVLLCWRWRHGLRALVYHWWTQDTAALCGDCSDGQDDCVPDDGPAPAYDVFVSVDEDDGEVVDFVRYWLLPFLERRRRNPLRVYLPLRQEPPGVSKGEHRCKTISHSRKVLVLLSKGYVSNDWCRYEFDYACRHVQQRNENDLVIVLLDQPRALKVMDTLTSRSREAEMTKGQGCCGRRNNRLRSDSVCSTSHIMAVAVDKDAVQEDGTRNARSVVHSECRYPNGRPMPAGSQHAQDNAAETRSEGSTIVSLCDENINHPTDGIRLHHVSVRLGRDDVDLAGYGGRAHNGSEDGDIAGYGGHNVPEDGDIAGYGGHNVPEDGDIAGYGGHNVPEDGDIAGYGGHNGPEDGDIAGYGHTGSEDGDMTHNAGRPNGSLTGQILPDSPAAGTTKKKKKKTKRIMKRDAEETARLEAVCQFVEYGHRVVLEPLCSFLLEGRYTEASERLFKPKLFFELSRKRKEKRHQDEIV